MISAEFRLGEPWDFAIDIPDGNPSLIDTVTVGIVPVERDLVSNIPASGPLFTLTGIPYDAAGDEPAGWTFEVSVDQQVGLVAGLIALDSKVVTIGGNVTFSPTPIFIELTNAAVR